MKALVTGAKGFIAGYLIEDMLETAGTSSASTTIEYGSVDKSFDTHPRYPYVFGDAKDAALLKRCSPTATTSSRAPR